MRCGWPGEHQSKRSRATGVVVPPRRGSICVTKHHLATAGRTITGHSTGHIFPQSSPTRPKESLSPTAELFTSAIYRRRRRYKPVNNFVRILPRNESEFPVAINTMGSRSRRALALQVPDIEDVAREIQLILKAKPPTDLREGWNLLKQGIHLLHARPKSVRDAPCQEVVHRIENGDNFSLEDLPILKCWPKDGGRFITLANVHTRDPETGARNVGIYRMQIYDRHTTAMHWQLHKVGARHGKRYYERGERMPVAVTLGGDPVYTFAAN